MGLKKKIKKVLFYVVMVVLVISLFATVVDVITHSKYQRVINKELGDSYVVVDCSSAGEPGVRVCYALGMDTEEDEDGYAVRLTTNTVLYKGKMSYDEYANYKGGE